MDPEEVVARSVKPPKGKVSFLTEPTAEEEYELEHLDWKRKLWDKVRIRR